MCGIVGYVGKERAAEVLIKGLRSLEYRGYDSSGIAVYNGANLVVEKRAGRIANLERALSEKAVFGRCGIGHTRWATHGAATDDNAHPFTSEYNKFAVVHNGIITNYLSLAEYLSARGVSFRSQTDSEVIAHLIDCFYTGDALSAICQAVSMLKGSFALGVISVFEPNVLYGVRKDSPLIVGKGERGNFICSDISGISDFSDVFCPLENNEIVRVSDAGVESFDFEKNAVPLFFRPVERDDPTSDLVRYGSYMLSEIHQIKDSLRATFAAFPQEKIKRVLLGNFRKIEIVGCGSAYHAALVFCSAMQEIAGVEVRAHIASEFLTQRWAGGENTLFIAVSQSGETADTLQAVRRAKESGAKILSVCNVRASSLVRLSDEAVITRCGTERAVAATKSYVAQVFVLLQICLLYADFTGKIKKSESEKFALELSALPQKTDLVLAKEPEIAELCHHLKDAEAVFFLGRGADYAAAKEGSLKLKEVSYLFSEAYPAGELKHGTLALMEKGVAAVLIATDPLLAEKNAASIAEVKCRGASAYALACENSAAVLDADKVIALPFVSSPFSPVLSSVAMQLIAYYAAKYRGCDMDKPRNLAKSVTVE